MAKYMIIPGSIDMEDGSVGTCLEGYKDVKYLTGDFNTVVEAAKKAGGMKTFEDAISWQRELIESGKPAQMKFVL